MAEAVLGQHPPSACQGQRLGEGEIVRQPLAGRLQFGDVAPGEHLGVRLEAALEVGLGVGDEGGAGHAGGEVALVESAGDVEFIAEC